MGHDPKGWILGCQGDGKWFVGRYLLVKGLYICGKVYEVGKFCETVDNDPNGYFALGGAGMGNEIHRDFVTP